MTVTDTPLTTRNATLADLSALLEAQHASKLDVVVPARDLLIADGNILVTGAGEPVITADGVGPGQVSLRPTATADANLAAKLDDQARRLDFRTLVERAFAPMGVRRILHRNHAGVVAVQNS